MTVNQIIQTLIPHLPRYAEEEGDFYSVKRSELIQALINEKTSQAVAENTLTMLENLLDTLATLKPDYLHKGEWCFISFPAQLMALSVLTAMGDSNSRFFETNFWNTQSISNDKKDQQREVLKQLENQRQKSHLQQTAQPIRYIYVAWSLIKHEGKILFYQREDTKKRHDKSAGDYGLVGGRLNQQDLSQFSGDLTAKLQALQSSNTALIKPALEQTLKRELAEEVGLIYEQHYTFNPWRSLKPYQQVQGSAPNHALTEYFLNLYSINLTLEGFCFLQQQIQKDDRLVWFTLDEMTQGKTRDGKIAYINALFADFDDRDVLKLALLNLEDSFSANYLFNSKKQGITFPQDSETPILTGALGKESALIDVDLDSKKLALLLGLAAHGRGFELTNIHSTIELYPYGWVKVQANTELQNALIQLAEQLNNQKNLVLESQQDCYFRLSINPEILFFEDSLFHFSVKQTDLKDTPNKVPCFLKRDAITTLLGEVEAVEKQGEISLELAASLQKLSVNNYLVDNDVAIKTRDKYRKKLHDDFTCLGMRGLVRQEAGMLKLYAQCHFS